MIIVLGTFILLISFYIAGVIVYNDDIIEDWLYQKLNGKLEKFLLLNAKKK